MYSLRFIAYWLITGRARIFFQGIKECGRLTDDQIPENISIKSIGVKTMKL